MLRLALGLVLAGWGAAAQAAQSGDDFSMPRLDLLTTRPVPSAIGFLPAYRFSASVALPPAADTEAMGSNFGGASQLSVTRKLRQEAVQATSLPWSPVGDDGHFSLPHLLRFEFKIEQVNVALRPRSILIDGEHFKVRLFTGSTLIERDRIRVMIQPHSTTVLWSNAF